MEIFLRNQTQNLTKTEPNGFYINNLIVAQKKVYKLPDIFEVPYLKLSNFISWKPWIILTFSPNYQKVSKKRKPNRTKLDMKFSRVLIGQNYYINWTENVKKKRTELDFLNYPNISYNRETENFIKNEPNQSAKA